MGQNRIKPKLEIWPFSCDLRGLVVFWNNTTRAQPIVETCPVSRGRLADQRFLVYITRIFSKIKNQIIMPTRCGIVFARCKKTECVQPHNTDHLSLSYSLYYVGVCGIVTAR